MKKYVEEYIYMRERDSECEAGGHRQPIWGRGTDPRGDRGKTDVSVAVNDCTVGTEYSYSKKAKKIPELLVTILGSSICIFIQYEHSSPLHPVYYSYITKTKRVYPLSQMYRKTFF